MKFKDYLIEKEAIDKTEMECLECGKKFKKMLGPKTFNVRCPSCKSTDVEPI